jgi:hypothetical protein
MSRKAFGTQLRRPAQTTRTRPDLTTGNIAMPKGLVSEDTSPSAFVARISSATLPINPGPSKLSWRRELNPRPSDYKSDALPTELRQPCSNRTKLSQRQSNCKQVSRPCKPLASTALIRFCFAFLTPYCTAGFENSESSIGTLWCTSSNLIVKVESALDWCTENGSLIPSTSR